MEKKFERFFGTEFDALVDSQRKGEDIYIVSPKENKQEYYNDCARLKEDISFFYNPNKVVVVPFEQRHFQRNNLCDFAVSVKAGLCDKPFWKEFIKHQLKPAYTEGLPEFPELEGKLNIMVVPAKLTSDENFGKTAKDQSIYREVLSAVKELDANLILGQHFHKVNDLEAALDTAHYFNDAYILGQNSHPEFLGLRGVPHRLLYNYYKNIDMVVGIPGTHTHIIATLFPDKPMVLPYCDGIEDWGAFAEACQEDGRAVYALKYNKDTDWNQYTQDLGVYIHKAYKAIKK